MKATPVALLAAWLLAGLCLCAAFIIAPPRLGATPHLGERVLLPDGREGVVVGLTLRGPATVEAPPLGHELVLVAPDQLKEAR